MILSFEEIRWRNGRFLPTRPKQPIRYKVVHISKLDDGSLMYQTRRGHFHESWIGEVVFLTEEDAKDKFNKRYEYGTIKDLMQNCRFCNKLR